MDTNYGFINEQKKVIARVLSRLVIPLLTTRTDTRETQINFTAEVTRALMSGVLLRLVLKYPKDFNGFLMQALESLPEVILNDLGQHGADGLSERLDRWVELFKRSQYVGRRKSSRTSQRTPHPIMARAVFELAKVCVKNWRSFQDKKAILAALKAAGLFDGVSRREAEDIAIMIADGTMSDREIALELSSKEFGIAPDTLERHYLRGTLNQVIKINEALKKIK